MCEYCGCQGFPALARLSEEHLRIQELAGSLRRAVRAGDNRAAQRWLTELTALLREHAATEERGLFRELRAEETTRSAVELLCAEHVQLTRMLQPPAGSRAAGSNASPDWTEVLAGVDLLRDHIDQEEYGMFPAAVILLSMAAWERITRAGERPRVGSVPGAAPPGREPASKPVAPVAMVLPGAPNGRIGSPAGAQSAT